MIILRYFSVFYCTEAASYPQFFPQVPKQNWGLLYLSTELSKAKIVPPQVVEKVINISVDNYENMISSLLIH